MKITATPFSSPAAAQASAAASQRPSSEAKRLDAFDEDFGCIGLGYDEFDSFGEVVFEGHGARIGRTKR